MGRETLIDFFNDFSRLDAPFLTYDDGFRSWQYRYSDVAAAAHSFAARLLAQGITKGDKIIVWGENRPEWIAALWGCLLAGAILVPIDYRASGAFLESVRRIVDAKAILIGNDVELAPQAGIPVWRMDGAMEFANSGPEPPAQISRSDTAEIIFTSGATAEPKGVIITHGNILANIVPLEREIAKYRHWASPFRPIRFLNLLPLSHMFGQSMATFVPPMLPGVVVFVRGQNPNEIVRQIRSRRISVLVCVPKMLEMLREHVSRVVPEAADPDPRPIGIARRWWKYRRVHRMFGWKFWAFVVGAAPLDPALEEYWGRLGFAVIQGYGLTETAPIVTLNHPFHAKRGAVGKPIGGVDVKIAPDGEILVRGENVTKGYFNAGTGGAFEDGWFHTGDIGHMDESGRLYVKGRKKEMIVTPDGLNVFPEDVERVLNDLPGVRDSAVVGVSQNGRERVHAVLVMEDTAPVNEILRQANNRLEDHQKIRGFSVWHSGELPRTEGTRKLKRTEIREFVTGNATPREPSAARADGKLEELLARYAGGREVTSSTTLDELGLSSLERVELLTALEDRFQTTIDEASFSGGASVEELRRISEKPASAAPPELFEFPEWNRSAPARWIRRLSLPTWILPIARIFAWIRAEGRENLKGVDGPVIFASNHQSHMDTPVIFAAMPGRWRYRTTVAMSKEFFRAHFFPEQHSRLEWFGNSLNYSLASLFFNAFPLPQREAGARQALRYAGHLAGDGWSILIYPEGKRTHQGELHPFQPGVAMLASRLRLPVVPVRIDGLDKVLHQSWKMAKPGRVRVRFGKPLTLEGQDYAGLARQVEEAVRSL
jgi:long-chain acyl-CoA synthetase